VPKTVEKKLSYSPEQIKKTLTIPSRWFIIDQQNTPRHNEQMICDYYIGDCTRPGKLYRRAVVPIFHKDVAVAFTGRTFNPLCNKCNLYHLGSCPDDEHALLPCYVKWRHVGLKPSHMMFNFYESLKWMQDNNMAIIVESVGNALRLIEAGIPAIASFGCSIKMGQTQMLTEHGIDRWIVAFDNDEAGIKGMHSVTKQYGKDYNLIFPNLNLQDGMDIANYQSDVIGNKFKSIINKYKKDII
jgi:hypothetical protein